MEKLLSLKWNNHKSTFIHLLGIFRDKQLHTDATIACEGKFYSVHKLVLSTCSDYFSAMLDQTNCKNPIIVLKDIKCEDLEALLDYMYLGAVNVCQSNLDTLIKAAECLRVKGLAIPDEEPLAPRKTKPCGTQSRRDDTSGSPPAKRKRYSDVDDSRHNRGNSRSSSPIHKAKGPSAPISTPLVPVHNRNAPLRHTEATVPPSSRTPQHQGDSNSDDTANNLTHNNEKYQLSDQIEAFVKVELDDARDEEVEIFKEEGSYHEVTSAGGGSESVGDLSNDLPEFLQHEPSNPLQSGNFGHSSAGSSSIQTGELPEWQGESSKMVFQHLNLNTTEGFSQEDTSGLNEVQSFVDDGRMDLAAAFILSSNITYQNLGEMIEFEESVADEDIKTFALILSVKAPKKTAKKLSYLRAGKEVETYHRLVLCRELQEGALFYILSRDATESCHLFRGSHTQFVGGFFAIYEGAKDKRIHDIPVVMTRTSLVPIVPQLASIMVNPVTRDLALNEIIQGFLIEILAPEFAQIVRVPSCRSRFCDTRHPSVVTCPALFSGKTTGHAITLLLSSPQHNIVNAEYCSESLMEIFVSPRVLANPKAPMHGLSRAVKEVSAHYAARNIPFIVGGWQKRRMMPGDEVNNVRKIHVTFIAPKKVLVDAPRYDPAPVVRPRPTASALPGNVVLLRHYMEALEKDEEY